MPLNTTALNAMADRLAALAPYLALHSADPGATGTNQTTAARVAAAWPAASGGDLTVTNKTFTGGTPGGPVTHVGLWSASTGGTFYGALAVTSGDQVFNGAGTYTVTTLTVDGAAA